MSQSPTLRVLLIDDDEDDFIIIRDLLKEDAREHCELTWAANGEQALTFVRTQTFDVCLLDYYLGGVDGAQVLRQLVEIPEHPAVIMVTGQSNEEIDRQSLNLGASDYIVKQEMTANGVKRSIRYAVGQRGTLLELQKREASLRVTQRAIEATVNGILICDAQKADYPITFVNSAFERITGYKADEVRGCNPRFLNGADAADTAFYEIRQALEERRDARVVMRNYRKDGSVFWNDMSLSPVRDEQECVSHFIGIINDVTENKRFVERLTYQANHDALTGLPNRILLQDRLDQAICLAHRAGTQVAVMFIDLDQFNIINDGIGRHVGDTLLQRIACRLQTCMREADTVARLEGDEFVVVCSQVAHEDDTLKVLQRIHTSLAQPIEIDEATYSISVSIGVAFYPKDGTDAAMLLRHAKLAMYRAKDGGRGNYQYFMPELNQRISQRVETENLLRKALDAGEFELHYQPQVNAVTGLISGMEALIRWHHPEHGLVFPGCFIDVAEDSGLIVPIGDWVLYEACRQMVQWQRKFNLQLPISINISVAQLRSGDFACVVEAALFETGLEPSLLELELTESMVMDKADMFVSQVQRLKDIGVRIAIDDFGVGYSSLAYLKHLPVDRVKIDYSFVRDIVVSPGDAAICRAIIAMAHSMQMSVVAEGVETEAQAVYLGRYYCDDLQGFYMSRPIPAAEIPALVSANKPLFNSLKSVQIARTLLIVDDEPHVIKSLRRLLRADGYNILTADSSEKGFELLASNEVSVIIADQRMPGMSGTDFLERVKELHPKTLRIVLSGFTDLNTVTASINRGAVYKFFLKPWNNEQLRSEVREAFWHAEMGTFNWQDLFKSH